MCKARTSWIIDCHFFFFEVILLHDRSLVRCDDNKKPCRSGDRFRMLSEDETNATPPC